MTRNLVTSWLFLLLLTSAAWSQAKPAAPVADKPIITVGLPPIDGLYEDMKMALDLVNDPKGYETLEDTISVFLDGIDTTKPSGLRVYALGGELPYVLSLPLMDEQLFRAKLAAKLAKAKAKPPRMPDPKLIDMALEGMLMNLWDLDMRTMIPPTPAQLNQVPKAVQAAVKKLMLDPKTERKMFNIFDGFLRWEPAVRQVHVGKDLAEVRGAKGGVGADFLNGRDLAVHIDGSIQAPDERRAAFAKAKKEVLGAVAKGEKETDAAFALRQALTEQQVGEVERFFAESAKIDIGWTTSATDKNAKLAIDLSAIPETSLEKSIELLGQTPDEFAGVSSEGTVLKGSINFPLDPMRKANLTAISKLARVDCKEKIDVDEKLSKEQKQTDKDLVDLIFDVVDEIGATGIFNGFGRVWSNGNATLTLCGGVKIPNGTNFVKILQTFAERGGGIKVELKADTEGEIEIHKLSLGDLQKDYPELLDNSGVVYVGTSAGAVWFAAGDKALNRLKQAIQEAKQAGPKAGPAGELNAQLYPLMEVFDKIRTRQKPPAPPKVVEKKTGDKKAAGDKKSEGEPRERAAGMLADLQLRKLALEAFKEGKDTLSLSLTREEKAVKLNLQLDEGIIRLVGKTLSKIVKDVLSDE